MGQAIPAFLACTTLYRIHHPEALAAILRLNKAKSPVGVGIQ
jgi:hypothetical protein